MVPTPHHDMSMLVCSVSHIWSCPPPRPFNACLLLLAHFVVPLPRPSNACLLVLVHLVAPTTHHVLSVSACLIFLPHLLVPPPRPSNACWLFLAHLPHLVVPPTRPFNACLLVLAHLVRPFSECLLLLSPTSVGAPTTIFQCLFARSCASGTPTPDRGLSMRACSFSHIGWCQTPHHDLSVSACWLFLPCLLVPPPPPPRPFDACGFVLARLVAPTPHHDLSVSARLFFSPLLVLLFGARVTVEIGNGAPALALARAAVWCKGYCGNW